LASFERTWVPILCARVVRCVGCGSWALSEGVRPRSRWSQARRHQRVDVTRMVDGCKPINMQAVYELRIHPPSPCLMGGGGAFTGSKDRGEQHRSILFNVRVCTYNVRRLSSALSRWVWDVRLLARRLAFVAGAQRNGVAGRTWYAPVLRRVSKAASRIECNRSAQSRC
jgi:hypothetical protein